MGSVLIGFWMVSTAAAALVRRGSPSKVRAVTAVAIEEVKTKIERARETKNREREKKKKKLNPNFIEGFAVTRGTNKVHTWHVMAFYVG